MNGQRNNTDRQRKLLGKAGPPSRFPIWYFLLTLALLWAWQEFFTQLTVQTIPYSEFKAALARREVVECSVRESEIVGRIEPRISPAAAAATTEPPTPPPAPAQTNATRAKSIGDPAPSPTEPFLFRTIRVEDPRLVEQLQEAGVKYTGVRPSLLSQVILAWLLPIGVMILLWMFLSRRFTSAGEGLLSIGKSKARLVADKETNVRFQDVAGCDEAKFELQEVVDFLRNPDRYKAVGAKIPKGVLLVGPPGTGKTLLARAVAGEAQVAFFQLSGSDFVEMFVGVGAARVRDLFQQAKAQIPCIIFIDELDAIGRQRGVHMGVVNDEREQTLNQLLVEMDGFEANKGVILLAATNRPDVLDRALLRPGRFDRQVVVDSPDVEGREAILKIHVKEKPLDAGVDLRKVAQSTPGFSGADLANAANEAALLAARRQSRVITQKDLEDAVEKVVAGPERKSRRLNQDERRRVACHEVGHALVAAHSAHADPVHKISVIPRGRAALGYTLQLPLDDQFLLSRTELVDRIRGLLGGRAAEEVVFGEVTTGAENDLERATALARQMICVFGMNDRIGLTHCGPRPGNHLAGPVPWPQKDFSEATAREIDEEVRQLLDRCYSEAREILTAHRKELETVTAELLRRETLDDTAFYALIGKPVPRRPKPEADSKSAPRAADALP